ncbi:MAG: acyl-CoA thioesterase [Deltaproteobacteria bacterium]|nr:acyl-CoA thioesterase [Deltaproteobacteria bacterium]
MPARFSMPITPTAADIDELGHVSNLVYLRWVLEVAMAHSRSVGWDHAEYRARGGVFVVRRHEIDYLQPVVEGESIIASTWVDTWRGASCIRKTEIARGEQIVTRAATTWAFMAFASGRPIRIPDDILACFTSS